MNIFQKNSREVFSKLQDTNPKKVSNSYLLDVHRKTHMLYAGNIKHKPPNKDFINSIVDLHDQVVKEMLSRNMKHNTPLEKI